MLKTKEDYSEISNITLKNNVKAFINDSNNIESIKMGSVGQLSIDIILKEPLSYDSYLYKNEKNKNNDFIILNKLFAENVFKK